MTVRTIMERFWGLISSDFDCNPNQDARFALIILRLEQVLHGQPGLGALVLRRITHLLNRVWLRGYLNAVIPPQVSIGPRFRLAHAGRGVVIHHTVRIGSDVTIFQQVTLGVRDRRDPRDRAELAPTVGDGVYIGAGAKVLGAVHLGDGCVVGANAVVVHDVPPGCTAVGVPAVNKSPKRSTIEQD